MGVIHRNVLWEFLKGIYKLVKWHLITVGGSSVLAHK